MQADATVIKHLNQALANELIAINQYFSAFANVQGLGSA